MLESRIKLLFRLQILFILADVDAVSGLKDTVKTPLVLAAAFGRCEMVELLVERGADLFYFDSDGHSALQLAQMNGHSALAGQLMASIECMHRKALHKNQAKNFKSIAFFLYDILKLGNFLPKERKGEIFSLTIGLIPWGRINKQRLILFVSCVPFPLMRKFSLSLGIIFN